MRSLSYLFFLSNFFIWFINLLFFYLICSSFLSFTDPTRFNISCYCYWREFCRAKMPGSGAWSSCFFCSSNYFYCRVSLCCSRRACCKAWDSRFLCS